MKTIWHFSLKLEDAQVITMPAPVEFLTVQMQGGVLTLWAIVNPGGQRCERIIHIRGTGHDLEWVNPDGYIGTVQDGSLVCHVFDGGWKA